MPPDVVWDDEPASPDVVWDDAAAPEEPSALEAWTRAAHQGATFGFADEAKGALYALGDAVQGKGFDYAKRRDEERAADEAARAAHPDLSMVASVGGTIGSSLIPGLGGAGKGASLVRAVGAGAALGAAQGLGSSEADLTKGEVGRAALDTGLGGLIGGAAGGLGHGLGKAAEWLGDKAAGGVRGAESDAAAAAWAKAQKAYRTAKSALGGEAAAGLNAVDQAEKIVANQSGHYTPALIAEAAQWLQSPEVAALRQRAAGNVLEAGQNRLPGSLATAEQVFAQAKQGLQPQAVEAAGAESLEEPFKRQIWPRVVNYASRAIPPIVGASVGGIPGAILGFGAGAVMGNPGTSLANAMRNPAVRRMAWQAVQSGTNALGKFGPALQRAATQGGIGMAHALHESLLESSPEYQHLVQRLLENSQGDQ